MKQALPNKLLPFTLYFLKSYKFPAIIFIMLCMTTGLWAPFNALLIKNIIDTLSCLESDVDAFIIFWPAVLFIVNFQLHNTCWRLIAYINYRFQPTIKNNIIKETFSYVLSHTQQYFQDALAGKISKQIETLADNIERIVHDLTRHFARVVVLLAVTFISMYNVHPTFLYILLVWFIIFIGFGIIISRKLIKLSEAHAVAESLLSGNLVDSITNSNNIRIFAGRNYELSYIDKALNDTKKTFRTKELFGIKIEILQGTSLTIMLGFMLYFLVQLKMQHLVTIGDFALILGLSVDIGFTTWWILEVLATLNKSRGKCNQSLMSLFTPLDIQDHENAANLIVKNGQIIFDNVKFHYKDSEALFHNKSVTIEPGQKVGLVGYSGGGKTTFTNLILRLYDVSDGRILIDGQDIKYATQNSLRNAIAMIPQDPSLFHRSLADNIRYGDIKATDDQVIDAAKKAHAHEFIMSLPQKYNSLVGERGVKLSGGQRQRIAIARAILKNAPILILDEATSQLDSVTEDFIQDSLWQLMQGKTTIVIAHRLSTLLHMDRILVFHKGKIAEDGTHEDLLAKGGIYRELWDAQISGFIIDEEDSNS